MIDHGFFVANFIVVPMVTEAVIIYRGILYSVGVSRGR